jgi:hypothetical protein
MKTIENILSSLEANATEFRRLCEAKVCSPDLQTRIDLALNQGGLLSHDIDSVMSHLLELKEKLEKPVDNDS